MSHEKHRGETTIASLLHHKSRLPSVITMALLVLGVIILIVYFNNGSGTRRPRAPRRTSRAGAAGKKDVGEAFFVFMQSNRWEVEELERVDHGVPACKGVAFCHGCGVRHHDLEPHNLQIGGWVGILWFDPSKRKCSLLFINQRHFLLSWMDGTPSI
ncbi:uncharacterized protein LOC125548788 isoform X3 [Triticum urartu]|uniref:uncharacterized protein LOC125548788 isoform X3 n=1 Tax=Triticum urartu TaxID=4572 RepID=UPI002043D0F6|nr:uncharacterized protein LOC125548788 isoform X3 [Triticum urartu]